jgi:hypothetical protein
LKGITVGFSISMLVGRSGVQVAGPLPDRPVRVLPDGQSGAVYCGAVYPLYEGGWIDLDDDPIDKDACRGFVTADHAMLVRQGSAPAGDRLDVSSWYVESNRFGQYLVFDSTETVAGRVATALSESKLGLIRWGESYRPADDGRQYEWFARLEFAGSRDDCLTEVSRLLVGATPAAPGRSC